MSRNLVPGAGGAEQEGRHDHLLVVDLGGDLDVLDGGVGPDGFREAVGEDVAGDRPAVAGFGGDGQDVEHGAGFGQAGQLGEVVVESAVAVQVVQQAGV